MKKGVTIGASAVALVGAGVALAVITLPRAEPADLVGTVTWVEDGDTVCMTLNRPAPPTALPDRCDEPDATPGIDDWPVRLIGIDAPELTPVVECFAVEATEALRARVEGMEVVLELDEAQFVDDTDYRRILGYLWLDGEFVNEWQVLNGYAWEAHYFEPIGPVATVEYEEQLVAAEAESRDAGRGLWSSCPDSVANRPPVPRLQVCATDGQCVAAGGQLHIPSSAAGLRFDALADGGPSYDPDGDPLGFEWLINGSLVSTFAGFEFDPRALGVGQHHVLLRVGDDQAAVTEAGARIVIEDVPGRTRPVLVGEDEIGGHEIVAAVLDDDTVPVRLVTVRPDGELTGVLFEGCATSPHWSPDRGRVAFLWAAQCSAGPEAVDQLGRLAVMSTDGTLEAIPLETPGLESGSFGFSWGPASTRLVADGGGSPNGPDRKILIADLDGGASMLPDPTGDPYLDTVHESYPEWSPDGAWVMWATGNGPADGVNLANQQLKVWGVDGTTAPSFVGLAAPGAYAWSPDSSRIAAAKYLGNSDSVHGVVSVAVEGLTRFRAEPPTFTAGRDFVSIQAMDWSPDGSAIVFSATQREDSFPDIWISRLDGSPPTRLSSPGETIDSDPNFGPDGDIVVYASHDLTSGTIGIYAVSLRDGAPRLVLANATQPDW